MSPVEDGAVRMVSGWARLLRLALGWMCVGVGFAGVVIPVLPTTPFLIVAVWAFSTSSRKFHDWLLNDRRFGPIIRAWRAHRVIPVRAKAAALGSMVASLSYVSVFVAETWYLPAGAGAGMAVVAVYIVTRPGKIPANA